MGDTSGKQPNERVGSVTDAQGLRRELNVLWSKSHTTVSGYIRSVVFDFHLAEDVLQETAAAVAEKFEEFDRARPFVPWVLGIARHKAIDALRSSSKQRLVFDEDTMTQLCETYSECESHASDVQIALERCLSRIQGRSRKLLEMRYLRDCTAAAIAATTGMTSSAVGVALYRIRKALHECVEEQLRTDGHDRLKPAGGAQ